MVIRNWKNEHNIPRISFCAISPVYMGATTHIPPDETPSRTRPITSIVIFCAKIRRVHPNVKGITSNSIVVLRPMKFIRYPVNMHTQPAPNVIADPTHENCSSVILNPYSLSFMSLGPVGEVQATPVPNAMAPTAAKTIENHLF